MSQPEPQAKAPSGIQEKILESVFRLAVKHQEGFNDTPVIASIATVEEALDSLPSSISPRGLGDEETYDLVKNKLLPALAQGQSGPRFFGFVTGGCLPSAQFGDILATVYDQNAGIVGGPGYSVTPAIEQRALIMLLELFQLSPETFLGRTLTTGSTAANVLGLACGREHAIGTILGKVYSVAQQGFGGISITVFADRAHSSLVKAAALVGIGSQNFIQLGATEEEIDAQLKTCGPGTGKAAIVSLSFGEVNTGSFTKNIGMVRAMCDKYNVWMHIDAAFGAFARISPTLKHFAMGLELADSICCDGHKWLNVPYDCGIFFSRSAVQQATVFGYPPSQVAPSYLMAYKAGEVAAETPAIREMLSIPQPYTLGIENSKRFRALAVYCALVSLGVYGYREIVERNVEFARDVADWMTNGDGKDCYEVLNLIEPIVGADGAKKMTVPLNIVLFRAKNTCPIERFKPGQPDAERNLLHAINEDRNMFLTPGPNGTLRMAVSNWMTGLGVTKDGRTDMEVVLSTLKKVMQETS